MVRIEHPALAPLSLRVFERILTQKKVGYYWANYALFRIIPSLPTSAAAPLAALIPRVENEGLLDYFVASVDELQQKQRAEQESDA